MKNQYVRIYSWMTELGLAAGELIVFAMIHAYTLFNGCFEGDRAWLAAWSCTSVGGVGALLDGLVGRRLIGRTVGARGGEAYASLLAGNRPGIQAGPPVRAEERRAGDGAKAPAPIAPAEEKRADGPASRRGFRMDEKHMKELMELVAPYGDLVDVPVDVLEEKLRLLEEREARAEERRPDCEAGK